MAINTKVHPPTNILTGNPMNITNLELINGLNPPQNLFKDNSSELVVSYRDPQTNHHYAQSEKSFVGDLAIDQYNLIDLYRLLGAFSKSDQLSKVAVNWLSERKEND